MSDQNVTEEMIAALIDGELPKDDITKVKKLLLIDPEARSTYESLLKTKQLFSSALDELKQDDVTQQFEDMIRSYPTKKLPVNVKWKLPMSMAASLVFGAGFTLVVMDRIYQQPDRYAVYNQEFLEFSDKTKVPVAISELKFDISDDQKQRINAALAVSSWPIIEKENQRLPLAADKFSSALKLLVTPGLFDLNQVTTLLEEAESMGHLGATVALAELKGDQEALTKYREIFSEKK